MRYRKLGNTDLNVSVVGIGTWGMSGQGWESSAVSNDAQSVETLRAAVDAGINFIDTALTYGSGHAEEIVGDALEGIRDRVVLATKCVADRESPEKGLTKDWRPEALRYQLEKSLRRMKTDVIDLYQVHWPDPDPTHPMEDAFRELNKMREEGVVRHIGVSNFTIEQIEQAMEYCPIATLQPGYSLLNRGIEDEILPFCMEKNIAVLSYGSLGGGVLSGKYTERPQFHTINNMVDPRNGFYPYYSEDVWPTTSALIEEMRAIAEKNNCRVVDVAIGWTVAQEGMTLALVGARNPEQAVMNANAGDFVLSAEDMARLTAASDHVREVLGCYTAKL